MIVHWHLLAEQLQQHHQPLEEELQQDVLVLAGQTDARQADAQRSGLPDEQEVLRRLQSRLGNFALQHLLSQREQGQKTDSTAEAGTSSSRKAETEEFVEPREEAQAPDAADIQGVQDARDVTRRVELLLRQILTALPALPVATLTELAMLVEQEAPQRRREIVDTLEKRINSLTPGARDALMKLIRRLPRRLVSGPLMAALLSRLLAASPPAPPPAPPVPPEE